MLETFEFDVNVSGAAISVILKEYVTPRCSSDAEIDFHINRLKAELEAIRKPMKADLLKHRSNPNELSPR